MAAQHTQGETLQEHPQLTMLSLEDAQKEMEQRLLNGWCMLGQHCPISNYPLVRKGGVTWSIRCQMEVQVANGDADSKIRGHAREQESQSRPESADADEARQERRDRCSSLIGQKLLIGWTLIEDICPVTQVCPLMRDRQGRAWSAAIGENGGYVDDIEAENGAASENLLDGEVPDARPTTSFGSDDWRETVVAEAMADEDDFGEAPDSGNGGEENLVAWPHSVAPRTRHVANGTDDLTRTVARTVEQKLAKCAQELKDCEDLEQCERLARFLAVGVESLRRITKCV